MAAGAGGREREVVVASVCTLGCRFLAGFFPAQRKLVSKIGINNHNKRSGKSFFSEYAGIYYFNMLTFSNFFGVEQRYVTVLHFEGLLEYVAAKMAF
jgi:hypothetical protein